MLQQLGTRTSLENQRVILGRKVQRRARRQNASGKALLAVDLRTCLIKLTIGQLCQLTGASTGYVATAARLTAAERSLIRAGAKRLSEFHNSSRSAPPDQIIDRMIQRFGAERVLAALDRATAPAE
jgi:hypothetical protein